jgi:cell cycle sensor histidine kinase DivJ
MSKIEAGRFDILAEAFEVGPLIDSCCDILSLKAEQAGVQLLRDYPPRIEELVADKRACRQILLNLLSNALKFTPRDGRITIGVRPEGNMLAFFVADTGIGIPDADLPRLGDAFFQASSKYDRSHEGTGLGLSVVRGLVGLHGGSMSIASREGEGTCVSVRLPLDCRSSAHKRTAVPIEIVPQRVAAPRPPRIFRSAPCLPWRRPLSMPPRRRTNIWRGSAARRAPGPTPISKAATGCSSSI